MAGLGRAESPVVQRTIQRRVLNSRARESLFWALCNFICTLFMSLEVFYGYGSRTLFGIPHVVACALAILFAINTVVNVCRYIGSWSSGLVELTEAQVKLLGVRNSDLGFRAVCPSPVNSQQSCSNSPSQMISASQFCPMSSANTSVDPSYSPQLNYSMAGLSVPSSPSPSAVMAPSTSFTQHSPANMSASRAGPSSSMLNKSGSMHSPAANHSAVFGTPSANAHLAAASFNQSLPLNTPPGHSPRDSLDSSAGLRSRFHNTSLKVSPSRTESPIKDLKDLDQYLKEQEEKDYRNQISMLESAANGGQSFWNYNRSVSDYSPMFRKYQYQIACRSPQSAKTKSDEGEDGPAQYEANEVWLRAGALMEEVDLWVEQLRKWIGKTIFSRLHSEIQSTNKKLIKLSCDDMAIGEVSISTLKQVAITKSQHLPNLASLIPFLEVSNNQEYVVHRILKLGSGGCISDFRWQSGDEFKDKAWAQHLPTDSDIVIHALCTYMDSRLPPHPKFPDGRTFTSQYFIKTPDKPNLEKKDSLLIYQTKINPPHFKVVIGDDIWNLPKGRNNLFHAILLFLHHVKTKQHGMLGKVNLGFSGINILRVLDCKEGA